jgi:DNA-binding SARP family transcriptional activator/Tfp pilus assembly protein PilF
MHSLHLFGGACIRDDAGRPLGGPVAQRRRLGVLALLAGSPAAQLSREKVAAYLWPEAPPRRAPRLLVDALYVLRRVLGRQAILSHGDELRLNPEWVRADVCGFELALAGHDLRRAASLYAGPFLDGFHVPGAPEFERWVEERRDHYARRWAATVEELAEASGRAGDHSAAADWWRRLAARDPFSARVTVRLMQALAEVGDSAGALRHAQSHARLLRGELGVEPEPEVLELAERLRLSRAPATKSPDAIPDGEQGSGLGGGPGVHPLGTLPAPPAAGPALPGDANRRLHRGRSRPGSVVRRERTGLLVTAGVAVLLLVSMLSLRPGWSPPPVAAGPAATAGEGAGAGSLPDAGERTSAGPMAEAHDLYLQGRFFRRQLREDFPLRAIEVLERAVALAPEFAAAHAELALAYAYVFSIFDPSRLDLRDKGFLASERALALDPAQPDAHLARGRLLWTPALGFQHAQAAREFEKAIALDATSAEAHLQLAQVYLHVGLLDEALEHHGQASLLNPVDPRPRAGAGQVLVYQMKPREALAAFRESPADLVPAHRGPHLAWALLLLDRDAEAADVLDDALARVPEDPNGTITAMQAVLAARAGDRTTARGRIDVATSKQRGSIHFHHTSYSIGVTYALLGDAEKAVRWLRDAAEDGFPCYPLFATDPLLSGLRGDPRFDALLAELWAAYHMLLADRASR